MYGPNWTANEGVERIVDEKIDNMKRNVDEFYELHNKTKPN